MTELERSEAEESWRYQRARFSLGSRHFPHFSILVSLIDTIYQRGYAEKLFAGAAHDNLVISLRPNARDRRQTILVIPQEGTIEFRLYPPVGEAEICTVAHDQAQSALECLLPRLVAK